VGEKKTQRKQVDKSRGIQFRGGNGTVPLTIKETGVRVRREKRARA